MIKADRRAQFTERWFKKAKVADDPFDRFFCLWIALVVAAQRTQTRYGLGTRNDTDAEKLKSYFGLKSDAVLEALNRSQAVVKKLGTRKGSDQQGAILDSGNKEQRKRFEDLSEHFLGRSGLDSGKVVEITAELLNKIRNNVFHGIKVYDDTDDQDLLNLINPLLESIIISTEGLGHSMEKGASNNTTSQTEQVHGQ